MDANMQHLEEVEGSIVQINKAFSLLSQEQGGKLRLSQVEMRDDLIQDRLEEIDKLDSEIKARKA